MPLNDWFDAATEEEALFDLLYDELLTVYQLGSVDGAVLLAKLRDGFSVDWGQINAAAAEWAENYAYDLVRELTATTRTQLQTALGAFFRTPGMTRGDMERLILQGPDGIPDLLDKRGRLISAAQRAEWIAVTETTRAYTAGEVATMEASGVDQVRPTQQPPAHVGCRCDISPFTRDDGIISWKWLTLNDGGVCLVCSGLHGRDVGAASPKRDETSVESRVFGLAKTGDEVYMRELYREARAAFSRVDSAGARTALFALRDGMNGEAVLELRAATHELVGLASFRPTANKTIEIINIGVHNGPRGIGTQAVRHIGAIAERQGLGLEAHAAFGARTYWEKLGMELAEGSSNVFRFSLSALRNFLYGD